MRRPLPSVLGTLLLLCLLEFVTSCIQTQIYPYQYEQTDGGFSWWVYPLAVRFVDLKDKTYYGFVDRAGSQWAASIDNNTHEHEAFELGRSYIARPDEHNAPCIVSPRKGTEDPIIYFYTGHDADSVVRFRKSTRHESIGNFSAEETISFSSNTTYVQAVRYGETIVVFTRIDAAGANKWVLRYSYDNGVTWEAERLFLDYDVGDLWLYMIGTMKLDNEGKTFRVAVGDSPESTGTQDIYLFDIKLDSGNVDVPAPMTGSHTIANIYSGWGCPFFCTSCNANFVNFGDAPFSVPVVMRILLIFR